MKLNMLFIVMDFLTLLAYPIIYMHNKIYQHMKSVVNHYNVAQLMVPSKALQVCTEPKQTQR